MNTGNNMIDGDGGDHPQSPNFTDKKKPCATCVGGLITSPCGAFSEHCEDCGGEGELDDFEEEGPDPDEKYDSRND